MVDYFPIKACLQIKVIHSLFKQHTLVFNKQPSRHSVLIVYLCITECVLLTFVYVFKAPAFDGH